MMNAIDLLPKLANSGKIFRDSAAVPDGTMGHNVKVRGCALLRSPSRLPGWV